MRDIRSTLYRPSVLSLAAVAALLVACSGPADKAPPPAVAAASAPASAAAPVPDFAQQVLGKWNENFTMHLPDGPEVKDQAIAVTGQAEYFPNKTVSFKGKGELKANGQDAKGKPVPFEVAFELQTADEWSVTDRTVYEKSVDLKIKVNAIRVNGKEMKDEAMRENLEKEMTKSFLHGETTALKTVAIDATHWRYEQELEPGTKVTVDALRP